MKIITIALEGKGGIGASATAVNLYIELSKTKKVLMIDIDENKHTTKFFEARKDVKKILIESDNEEVRDLEVLFYNIKNNYDFVIIDSGKYISKLNDYALQISDMIIVPTSDSDSDYIQAQQFIDKLIDTVTTQNDYTEVKMLVNRVRYNSTKFHKEMVENYQNIERVGVFKTIVAENSAYKRMSLSGMSASELTKNERVISDIKNLTLEVQGV